MNYMAAIVKIPKTCDGCYERPACNIKRIWAEACPCKDCVIKMVCKHACDKFHRFELKHRGDAYIKFNTVGANR